MLPKTVATRHSPVFSPVAECTVPISDSVALRAYSCTRPFNLKIADLQKGLIFVNNGAEVVGEGTGFGVPILKYPDETYFSSSSSLHVSKQDTLTIVRKEFHMDAVARNKLRNVKLENRKARASINILSNMYQRHGHFRFLILKDLLHTLGVHASFVRVPARGKVTTIYHVQDKSINVKVDFSLVKKTNLRKIFVLNEQSSLFFRAYSDSDGLRLTDENIGAWEDVKARWARITDYYGKVGFSLMSVNGSFLRRGREYLRDLMDWVGLDYEISPNRGIFEYEIGIVES